MTPPVVPTNDSDIQRARTLARALDALVGIPGTRIRFGGDAILGLIPGAGDVAGALLSAYIVQAAARRGAPQAVLWRMVANIAVDSTVGVVPVLGDLFDVGWKSNLMNVELLERYAAEPQKVTTRSRLLGAVVVGVAVLVVIGLGALSFLVARALWRLLTA